MDQNDKRGERPGNVYVMRRADGVRKVGTAVDLRRRVKELRESNGQPMEVEIFWTMSERATWFVESQMHTILRPCRCDGNEYYDASLRQAIAAFRCAKDWARQYVTDGDLGTVLAVKRLGTSAAAKRLGYKTPAAYLRRLAVAEANAAKAAVEKEKVDE